MPGPLTLAIWYVGIVLEIAFVVCSIARKSFFRYLFLNTYFLLGLGSDAARYFFLSRYGQGSDQYRYAYFYTDALLTLALYVALISLYSKVFGELELSKYVRFGAVVLLLGTALFSYAVVVQSEQRLATTFAYELSQNLYFVGLVLTYVLWGAVVKLRETRTRLVQIILSLGLYFSAYAACYALGNLSTRYSVVQYLSGTIGCLLPLAWTVTMWRYTEESRLEPARLLAVAR
jgi:uncharacterized membrane protein